MPRYTVKPGKSFFYVRMNMPGDVVDYPGPAGESLELADGEEPWTSPHQQGCEPGAAGGSAPAGGADAPANLADRLDRARSASPSVALTDDKPMTMAEIQAQDRAREDASRDKWNGADPAAFDHDHKDGPGGSPRGGVPRKAAKGRSPRKAA